MKEASRSGFPALSFAGRLLQSNGFVWTVFFLLAAGLVAWNFHFGFQLFSGMDGGVLISAAWQEFCGGVPYHDFLTASPPLFLLPAGWAFRLLGPTWFSLVCLTCLFSVLTFAWCFVLLWDATKNGWNALCFSVVLQSATIASLSWWWYNEISLVVAGIYFCSVYSLLLQPAGRVGRVSFVVSEAMLGLLKVNIAAPLLLLSFLWLMTKREVRSFVLPATGAAIGADLLFLAVNHISLPLLFENYLNAPAGRMSLQMYEFFLKTPAEDYMPGQWLMIVLLVIDILLIIRFSPRQRHPSLADHLMLLFLAVMVAAINCGTNYLRKTETFVCLFMTVPFLGRTAGQASWIKRACFFSAGLILVYFVSSSFRVGFYRSVLLSFGRNSYAGPVRRVELSAPPLFRGLAVEPKLAEILRDTEQALRDHGAWRDPRPQVFFGPNIDFSYAAFDLLVPRGLPLWWEKIPSSHRGDAYPMDHDYPVYWNAPSRWIREGEPLDPRVRHFLEMKIDLCIFLKSPEGFALMTFMPGDLRADLYENYVRQVYPTIVVFTRKTRRP